VGELKLIKNKKTLNLKQKTHKERFKELKEKYYGR
jgi:hypothetical protein